MLLTPYEEAVAAGTMPDPVTDSINGHHVERVTEHCQVYDRLNGVHYSPGTILPVLRLLATYMHSDARLRFHYGDVVTGQDWCDEWDVEGRLSTSMGPIRIPILCNKVTSSGGGGILSACIVRLRTANRASSPYGDLYRHPDYFVDMVTFRTNITDEKEQARVYRRHFA